MPAARAAATSDDPRGSTHPPETSTSSSEVRGPDDVLTPPPPAPPGPPPPPASVGSDGEARATAATWVAAAGAVLLLAAAGTFLAVSWDALGLTARIAIVAAGTGAAIVGGLRLRSVLPAVGAVVFHLGALLVPVDALGLAFQLEASSAGRWLAVGATGVVVLPALAVAGRSAVLAWSGVAALPVFATGVALLGGPIAPLAVAVVALLLVLAATLVPVRRWVDGRVEVDPLRRAIPDSAGPALAILAVFLPLVVAVLDAWPGTGGVLRSLTVAGWLPTDWLVIALTGAIAVAALALVATRRASMPLAIVTLATAIAAGITTILPAGTPRLAVLIAVPMAGLLLELTAAATRHDRTWAPPTRAVAAVAEVLAILVGTGVILGAVLGERDVELAISFGLAATAWLVAGLRRVPCTSFEAVLGPLLVGVAVLHGVAAVDLAGWDVVVSLGLLVGVALATVLWTELVRALPTAVPSTTGPSTAPVAAGTAPGASLPPAPTGRRFASVAPPAPPRVPLAVRVPAATASSAAAVGVVLATLAAALATGSVQQLATAAAVAVVGGVHLHTALAARRLGAAPLTWSLGPVTVIALLLAADAAGRTSLTDLVAVLVASLALAGLAHAIDRLPAAADGVRGVLMLLGLVAVTPPWPSSSFAAGGNTLGADAVAALGLVPSAVVPSLVAVVLLLLAARVTGRSMLVAFAAPVAVRVVIAGSLATGLTVTVAAVVLFALVAGAATAGVLTPRYRAATITFAAIGVPIGWLLVGDARVARACVLLGTGGLLLLGGVVRRVPWAGYLGGVVATFGLWDLLGAFEVTAVDVWVLPVAVYLWVAAHLARRAGTLRSSWAVDVPPLLLVVVPAVVERATGGSGWHAVLAGAVAVLAIVVGGVGRHAGPLVVGTIALLAVVLVETFAVVAAVPTWAWLSLGGLVLLAAAAVIERTGGTPVRAARRVLDVVGDRFD
jgi:hypothetical protein